jgi:hypothetical protein
MQVTYQLNEAEIGPAFLESLKAAFRGQTLRISVETASDAANSQQALTQKITEGIQADHAYRLSYEEIAQLADSLEADESVDPVAVFKAHRVAR